MGHRDMTNLAANSNSNPPTTALSREVHYMKGNQIFIEKKKPKGIRSFLHNSDSNSRRSTWLRLKPILKTKWKQDKKCWCQQGWTAKFSGETATSEPSYPSKIPVHATQENRIQIGFQFLFFSNIIDRMQRSKRKNQTQTSTWNSIQNFLLEPEIKKRTKAKRYLFQ